MRIIATIAFLMLSSLGYCADTATPQNIADHFFKIFLENGNVAAIDEFLGLNPMMKNRSEQLKQMKTQLFAAVQLYGKPMGVEVISVEELTPSLQRRVYLTKHSFHPLIWEMYFYKPKDEWLPDQLIFLDQYQGIGPKK